MRKQALLRSGAIFACTFFAALAMNAQTSSSIQVFSPVNVRPSASGTGYGSSAVNFNSATLNLSCPAGAVPTATLSSTADGTGNVLVDNLIQLSVTTGSGTQASTTTPVNVCQGGTSDTTPDGTIEQDCFTTAYQTPASAGTLNGVDPDTLTANGGVAPLNISSYLPTGGGSFQLNINLVDEGGWLASSSIYLNTSCSQGSVTGPAQISGNPISDTNPTTAQLTQTFGFNTLTGQQIQLVYDLSQAQTANSLTITNSPIPQGGDMPIDQATFQSVYEPGTSFATSSCLIHTGESLNNAPACKLFTVECTTGTGSSASGAQCPVSSLPNEVLQDVFDGPAFTLSPITAPSGTTFHEGIGFLMANEGWTGGPCVFDPNANLQDLLCPQNLLAYFSGPGLYDATGHVSHPNSTFVPIYGVPEDLTSVTVTTGPAGTPVPQQPGGWINNSTANVMLSSQPPILAGLTEMQLPGITNFVPSPIQTITYGISAANSVPTPMAPATTDTTVTNDIACPTSSSPTSPAATVFAAPVQVLTGLADGSYLLHYYAQDCAGTEELQFTQAPSTGVWSTNYYTFPINVDTIAPVVASLTLPATTTGSYTVGQPVMASYSCTDERSGVVKCGASTYPYTQDLLSTGPLTSPIDTSSPGMKTFTVTAMDAAGNQSTASVPYTVVQGFDSAITLTLSSSTVTYPLGTNVVISVASAGKKAATGTVKLEDGSTVIASSTLGGNGAAYLYIQNLNVGAHILTAVYSGDASNPAGTSAPVTLTVKPVSVQMTASCWNLNYPYGVNFQCGVYASSAAGPPQGVITYQYDGGAAVSVPLQFGVALFTITKPVVGNHTLAIGYAAQTNYAAATPVTVKFVVTPAPVIVLLTPSSWYLTGGNLTLSVSISSWSAGPPNQLGTVTFYDGSKVLATVPVTATGTASTTLAASSLANGSHSLKAVYSGSTNYASGTGTAVISVAVK